jgi:elongation factor 1-alpha
MQDIVLKKLSDSLIRVAVVGNVDAGKSTLIGTLVTSTLDDGRGTVRSKLTKFSHEVETGRTSTIQTHLLGLDGNHNAVGVCPANEMVLKSHRLVSLMDLAGVRIHACRRLGAL